MVKQTVQDYMLNWLFLYNNRALQVSFPDTDIRSSCTLSVSMRSLAKRQKHAWHWGTV